MKQFMTFLLTVFEHYRLYLPTACCLVIFTKKNKTPKNDDYNN